MIPPKLKNIRPPKSFDLHPSRFALEEKSFVQFDPYDTERPFLLVATPTIQGIELTKWLSNHLDHISTLLLKHGAILFRNFNIQSVSKFKTVISAVTPDLIEYYEASTPRKLIGDKIYTSTNYPPSETIFLHNEMSYTNDWPMKIWFFCEKPADSGGHTPIADCRAVYRSLKPEVKAKFDTSSVMYTRTCGGPLGRTWQSIYGTDDKTAVEHYCRDNDIRWEWISSDTLHTKQVRQATASHPQTKDIVWFNQAHAYHNSTLKPSIRNHLTHSLKNGHFPRDAYYGDGSQIDDETIAHILDAYEMHAIYFDWQAGDLLLLDNMLIAHGRTAFSGERHVLTAMAQPYRDT